MVMRSSLSVYPYWTMVAARGSAGTAQPFLAFSLSRLLAFSLARLLARSSRGFDIRAMESAFRIDMIIRVLALSEARRSRAESKWT